MKLKLKGNWNYLTDPLQQFSYSEAKEKLTVGSFAKIMKLPVNWQLAGLDSYNGTVWFAKKFNTKRISNSGKLFILEFLGIDYFADVWFNDIELGHHEGYFQSFYYDVSPFMLNENLLIVKVTSPFEEPGTVWPLKKKLIKGIFNHHDCRPGGWDAARGQDKNTGGIWNDVILHSEERIWISNSRVEPKINFRSDFADLKISIDLVSAQLNNPMYEFRLIITSPSQKKIIHKIQIRPTGKPQTVSTRVRIHNPELWWSRDLGEPNLYTLKFVGAGFSGCETRFGIREAKLDEKKIFYLNGKRLFLRGTNIIPTQWLSDLTKSKIKKQVNLIAGANLNIVRLHAHVNRKEFYDECDRLGIMVWQDFPLQWTYDELAEFEKNAVAQIREMVRQRFNHPSIVFWCCHNEPGSQIETLDKKLFRAVKEEDCCRIVRKASNYEEHAYEGWYWGHKEHYAATPMGPLVTEFGAQAIPAIESLKKFLPVKEITTPNWQKWKYHNFQYEQTFQIAGIGKGNSTRELVENSQRYQADLIMTAIDFYRRKKFNGINAIFQFMLIDCWPSITWSVVDYYFVKKAGYLALKEAMQPLYISIFLRQKKYFPGSRLNFDLWIINDLHKLFGECRINFKIGKKWLGEIKAVHVEPDSIRFFSWETINLHLPANLAVGNHHISVSLESCGVALTSKKITVEIEKELR